MSLSVTRIAALVVATLLLVSFVVVDCKDRPAYDHQTKTYTAKFQPLTIPAKTQTITPFFSPDRSAECETKVIEKAKSFIDIGAPSWGSWSRCGTGCTPDKSRAETFPLFQALLNALHRGVKVRLLTNDFNSAGPGAGLTDPLTFLALNGADIRYYTTTTFLHTKYVGTDQSCAISSVNFGVTSFTMNREAGVVLEGDESVPARNYIKSIFESDFAQAYAFKPNQKYSADAMKVITNKATIPVVVPPRRNITAYITGLETVRETSELTLWASPDFAFEKISAELQKATRSLHVEMYQITDEMCGVFLQVAKRVKVTLLLSNQIFSKDDYFRALACYKSLSAAGVRMRKTNGFTFAHQKMWLVDYDPSAGVLPTTSVALSTGNWGTSDYPPNNVPNVAGNTYPAYGSTGAGWRSINRDYTVKMTSPKVMKIFYDTLMNDYARGFDYTPNKIDEDFAFAMNMTNY